MKKLLLALLLLFLLTHGFTGVVFAKATLDLTQAGVGARPTGMGRAYVAVANDSNAVFLNPAGIASAKSWGLTSMSTKLMNRVDYKLLGGIYPTQYGVFGLGYIGANTPAGYYTTDKDSLTGAVPISYGSSLFVLSYAKKLSIAGSSNAAIGANLKVINNGFSGVNASGTGFDLDLGIVATPRKGLTVGAVVQNFLPADMGASVNWNSNTKEGIPSLFKVGASYYLKPNLLLAGDVDFSATSSRPVTIHTGVEWKPLPLLALRAGLDQNPAGKDTVTDFSIGVGLNVKGFQFDYAYKNNSLVEKSNAHYFSLSIAADQFKTKKTKSLVEKASKPTTKKTTVAVVTKAPKAQIFASTKERNEYLYKVATGKIKPVPAKTKLAAK